ncbi:SAM-dependent methyltransferase [Campylobacterota bacterium]|nr:SAM-dependent methyltransferase [Campylobacterota bacterium]
MSLSKIDTHTHTHTTEIATGDRFAFGDNWTQFLKTLNDDRIDEAVNDIKKMLGIDNLNGKTFLDIGSGSGLHSLAAKRLGAERVYSFDYDPSSVACTAELKRRYYENDESWTVEEGSALDGDYLQRLGTFDIVYSWGVLHHTGDMYRALELVDGCVKPDGKLFLAIYNDQGAMSQVWLRIKKTYLSAPRFIRPLIVGLCYIRLWGPTTIKDFLKLRPFYTWRSYAKNRGMSAHTDVIDWVGGYPFEVAKPEAIFNFYRTKGYQLEQLFTCGGGIGCNQFVFGKGS